MVRGRRARVHETTSSSTVTLSVNGSQFADDQYCASPKRKDCRIDEKNSSKNYKQQNLKQNGTIKVVAVGLGSSSGGGGGGHQRQIKDMFRTATRSQSHSIKNNNSSDIKCSQSMHSKIKSGCIKKIFANGNHIINGKSNNYHHYVHDHRDDDDDDSDDINDNEDEDDIEDDDDDTEILSTEMYPTKNNENYVNHDIIKINVDDEQIENYDNDGDCNIKITRNKRNMKRSHNQRKQQNNHTTKNSLKTPQITTTSTTATTSTTSSSNNIFLQEPVLCLNVDKSPNQPSSIKINKTFEVNPIFSLQSNHNNNHNHKNFHHLNLNGQFNKIVTLNTSPKHNNEIIKKITNNTCNSKNTVNQIAIISSSSSSSSTEGSTVAVDSVSKTTTTTTTTTNTSILLNSDSNSCDSGVVIDTINKNELSPNRRRKPATPHRIVCPSPVKHAIVEKLPSSTITTLTTSTALSSSSSSSSSTSSLIMNTCGGDSYRGGGGGGGGNTASLINAQQKRHPKSRRRLNANHYENSSMTSPQLIGGIILSTDTLKKINNNDDENNDDNNIGYTNILNNQKSILNSAKNPTAEQNTNNNFKSCHQASNQQKRNNGHHNHKELSSNPIQENNGNKKLTDYFPVRRSVRKTKKAVQEEIMQNIEKAILEGREDGLKIEYFDDKGRGVVAERSFKRGEFVVEYIGDLITMSEANQREKKYSLDENAGCYMYYFKHKNQQYCIDATAETGKFGRLVNHSRNGNLITKIVVVKNRPHLVLIAKDDIQPGEELTYDYGDRSKESLLHHPWLAL